MFGYGFGISDVRVTLGNDSEVDCLQKIHPVGRYVAVGFAGSVQIGFAMVERLRELAYMEDERLACDPLLVAQRWPQYARLVFEDFPTSVRDHQCDLMVIAAHPQEHTGNPLWARSYVYILRSPNFEPEAVAVHEVGSIGCGGSYEECRSALEAFSNDFRRREMFTRGEVGTQGGIGTMLGFDLTQLLMRALPRGISAHLHYCWVYRGRIIIKTNDHTQRGRWSILEHGSGVNYGQGLSGVSPPEQSMPEDAAASFKIRVLQRTGRISCTFSTRCR
jgi:hypothetical protein